MYYMIFFIGILLSMINDKKRISFKLFALILTILAFFRYGVGADYFAYNYLYSRLSESVILELKYGLDNQEILFRLIGSLLKKGGLSYQHYLMLLSTVNIYFICKTCKRYSKNPTLSLLAYYCFYYFVWTFSGLRQGVVLSVGVYYLLECLESKKIIKLISIAMLLSLIHTSAIFLIILYLGAKINFDKKRLTILSCIAIALSIIPIGNIITKLTWIPFISRLLPYISHNSSVTDVLDFQSLGRIIFIVIGLFYYNSLSHKDDISKKIINIYILSLIFYFLFKFTELTAARLSIYGAVLNILILPNIYYLYKNKFDKFIYLTCLGILCLLYFNKELYSMEKQAGLMNESNIIVPYTNIFNKDKYMFNNRYFDYLN